MSDFYCSRKVSGGPDAVRFGSGGVGRRIVPALTLALALLLFCPSGSMAQSRNFKLLQGLEIQNNILKTLATEYVDTIDFSKLVNYGIDAMLESIDPYTEYVPQEDEIAEIKWVEIDRAGSVLAYDNDRSIVNKAKKFIR